MGADAEGMGDDLDAAADRPGGVPDGLPFDGGDERRLPHPRLPHHHHLHPRRRVRLPGGRRRKVHLLSSAQLSRRRRLKLQLVQGMYTCQCEVFRSDMWEYVEK